MAELKSASLSMDNRDLHVLLHGMRDKYLQDLGTVTLLRIARERELERHERFMLPETLKMLSREELVEQIDAWISLCEQTLWLVRNIEQAELATSPPMLIRRRERREIL
jgi:hypothetical protein